MKKIISLLAIASFVLAGLTACSSTAEEAETIKIGFNMEKTGDYLIYGAPQVGGVELAVNEINAAGGIDGKLIELISYDNKSDATESYNNALKLATEDEVVAIIGAATSGLTVAQQPVATEYGTLIITPSGSNSLVTVAEDGTVFDTMYRTCFIDPFQGIVLANFASTNLGLTKAAILGAQDSDYAIALAGIFKDQFVANGGTVVAEEAYPADTENFSAIITKLMATDAEVLYVPAYADSAQFVIKQARELGWNVPILGPDGFDSTALQNAGAANLNDVYFSTHFTTLDENPKVAQFVADYKALTNEDPFVFSALAYDAVYLLAQAIDEADSLDPAVISEKLSAINFTGITGTITFDEKHNPVKSAVVIEMVDGVYSNAIRVNP